MNGESGQGGMQAEHWQGDGGDAWVELQPVMDRMFAPIADLVAAEAEAIGASDVFDVGCGTGATALAVSHSLPGARCTGIDLSGPMLAVARRRFEAEGRSAEWLEGDAEAYDFGAARFDLFVSRFGVMFFADPLAAFANLRGAALPGAALRFVVWRDPGENPFMTVGTEVAMRYLPDLPARQPNQPGPFGLADRERTRRILDEAGWTGVEIEPREIDCAFPVEDLDRYLARIGPVSQAAAKLGEPERTELFEQAHAAYERFVEGETVRFTAACWLLRAENPAST